ncbi:MAG: Zn-dependent hydrolase, partial [Streptosporangiaceae bacterium]|nr:Zn-dependent hydrolase [Streptosporangiaceae bacterium]
MHTPGHSPDSICLLDDRNGLLSGGDTINTGPIYAQLEDSDVEAFAQSTPPAGGPRQRRCVGVRLPLHRVDNSPALLVEIADGFERLLD